MGYFITKYVNIYLYCWRANEKDNKAKSNGRYVSKRNII